MKNKAAEMEKFFQALGDKTRLRILNLIGDGEVSVCFFIETLDELQPKISRHLAYLRRSGLVATRRDRKWIYYRLAEPKDEAKRRILDEIRAWMEIDEQMRKDRERLMQIFKEQPEAVSASTQSDSYSPTTVQKVEEFHSREIRQLEDFML